MGGKEGGQHHRASLVGTNMSSPALCQAQWELRRLTASVSAWPVLGWVVEPGSVGERGRRLSREEGPLYMTRERMWGVDATLDTWGRTGTNSPAWCPPDLYQRPWSFGWGSLWVNQGGEGAVMDASLTLRSSSRELAKRTVLFS